MIAHVVQGNTLQCIINYLLPGNYISFRWSALISAIMKDHKEVASYLLDVGADVNETTQNQDSPLILASKNELPEMVELLVGRKAALNHKGFEGFAHFKH